MTEEPAFTFEEIVTKLEELSKTDIIRLTTIAAIFSKKAGMLPEDLLSQAILSTIEMRRKCPQDVLLLKFLANAMRSIADNERRKKRNDPLQNASSIGNTEEDGYPYEIPSNDPSPESILIDEQESKKILDDIELLFQNDSQALAIIIGDIEGWSPEEVCELEGMTRKEYEAARKRRLRKLQKYLSRGY